MNRPKSLRLSDLSRACQLPVRLCQAINHGSIEDLEVTTSEPVLDPIPVTLKDLKLDSDEGPAPRTRACGPCAERRGATPDVPPG
jgi:hypothetical protein